MNGTWVFWITAHLGPKGSTLCERSQAVGIIRRSGPGSGEPADGSFVRSESRWQSPLPSLVAICKGLMINQNILELSYLLLGGIFLVGRCSHLFIYIHEIIIYKYIHDFALDMYSIECIRVFKFKYIQVCIFMICANADMYVYLIFFSVEILARFHTFSPQKACLSEGLCLFMRLVWKRNARQPHMNLHLFVNIFTYIYVYNRCKYKSIYIYLYICISRYIFPHMRLP